MEGLDKFGVKYIIFCDYQQREELLKKLSKDFIVAHKYKDTSDLLRELVRFPKSKGLDEVAELAEKAAKKDFCTLLKLLSSENYCNATYKFQDFKMWLNTLIERIRKAR